MPLDGSRTLTAARQRVHAALNAPAVSKTSVSPVAAAASSPVIVTHAPGPT